MFLCLRGKRFKAAQRPYVLLSLCSYVSRVSGYQAAQRRQHKRSPLSIYISINSVLLDKLAARTYIVAHKHGEHIIGIGGILERHLLEQT